MREWLNINELAKSAEIPDTTIRRYVSKFSPFFVHKGGARSRRYEDSAVKVLKRIKSLYEEGFETEEVDRILRTEFSVVMDGDKEQENFEKPAPSTLATVEDIEEIKQALNQQQEFNKLLLEKLSNQETYIKEILEKHEKLLLESKSEEKQEVDKVDLETAVTAEEPKQSIFKKLFGKK